MSNNSPTPGRLDSLKGQRSSLSGAKPGTSLKFQPKVVARRSKEERDADAPIIVSESTQLPRATNMRGRGTGRGRGRGGIDRHAGTHIVSSGPLSAGFVSMESNKRAGAGRTGISPSPTPEFIKNLKVRSQLEKMSPSVSSRGSLSSDDDDDSSFVTDGDTKINMSKEYMFDENDTELFPVRAPRSDHRDYAELDTVIELKEQSVTPKMDNENTIEVKAEQDDIVPSVPLKSLVDPLGSEQVSQEKSRLAFDHEKIHSLLSSSSSRPSPVSSVTDVDGDVDMESNTNDSSTIQEEKRQDGVFFFQLPKTLPEFKSTKIIQKVSGDEVKEEKPEGEEEEDDEEVQEVEVKKENELRKTEPSKDGQIGTLRYHKSGKITMKLGNVIFDVSRGGNTEFLQDVVYIKNDSVKSEDDKNESQESEPEIYHLGEVLEKIVVTPRIDG